MTKQTKEIKKVEVTPEEQAMKVLQEAEQKRQDVCSKELEAVLQKYGYSLAIKYDFKLVPIQK